MPISTHFPNITLTADQQIAVEKINTFLDSEDNVFMLKGYAGTGKTTLIKGLVSYLEEQKKIFQLRAPTVELQRFYFKKLNTVLQSIKAFINLKMLIF